MAIVGRYSLIPTDAVYDKRMLWVHLQILCDLGARTSGSGWVQAGQNAIAARLDVSRRTVVRRIKDLVEFGYVKQVQRFGSNGRKLVCDYQVRLDTDHPGDQIEADFDPDVVPDPAPTHVTPVSHGMRHPGVSSDVTPGCHNKSDLTPEETPCSSDLSKEDAGDARASDFLFQEFWARYPWKANKSRALAAWRAALKSGVPAAEIIAGLDRYVGTRDDRQKWLGAVAFLEGARWRDEPAPPKPTAPRARSAPAASQAGGDKPETYGEFLRKRREARNGKSTDANGSTPGAGDGRRDRDGSGDPGGFGPGSPGGRLT